MPTPILAVEGRFMSLDTSEARDQPPSVARHFAGEAGLTVWFDGGSPLCRREIAVLRRLDRRSSIKFEDIRRPDSVCTVDRGRLLARSHAQEKGEPLVSGAASLVQQVDGGPRAQLSVARMSAASRRPACQASSTREVEHQSPVAARPCDNERNGAPVAVSGSSSA